MSKCPAVAGEGKGGGGGGVMGTVGIDWCITVYYKSQKKSRKTTGTRVTL